ncbi:MAG: hypothetical protein M3P43_05065, partial [Actinomycetota bacterium]|nr:hypothetical protein [Actinomycetota bacterium]
MRQGREVVGDPNRVGREQHLVSVRALDQDITGGEPNANIQPGPLRRQRTRCLGEIRCGSDRPDRVVLVKLRDAEHERQPSPEFLVDGSATFGRKSPRLFDDPGDGAPLKLGIWIGVYHPDVDHRGRDQLADLPHLDVTVLVRWLQAQIVVQDPMLQLLDRGTGLEPE